MKRMDYKRNGLWLVATGVLLCTGCSHAPRQQSERTIGVRTLTVAAAPTTSTGREYVGQIEEESATALSFPVQGTVSSVSVEEGARVAAGTVVAQLDRRNLQSVYNGAKASLAQAEDAMQRLQQLYDNGSLPEIQYVEAQTKLAQARAMEEVARKNLDDAQLVAPFSGVIGRQSVEAGENVLPGQTVCMLLKTNQVKVKIPVPENEIATIASGCPARITVAALNDRNYHGTVTEKGATANPVSHTYEVRIPLPNPDGALMPGMVCRVTLQGDTTASAVVLPNRAVQVTGRGERFVWCVREGRAVRVPVVVDKLSRDGVVISQGLTPGDQVITEGAQKISDGMKVEVL